MFSGYVLVLVIQEDQEHMKKRWRLLATIFSLIVVLLGTTLIVAAGKSASASTTLGVANNGGNSSTTTPIKHLVVIFGENISFDHYFGTYPVATNPKGEPAFNATANTPSVNGLTPALLTNNPNSANPFRLDRSQALTCDQDHGYSDEQKAY